MKIRRINVAYLLLLATAFVVAIRFSHLRYIDAMRERYLATHGEIDIPEAMYFDGLAVGVQGPLLLVFLVLQVPSAVIFCRHCRGVEFWKAAGFWIGWSIAWPACLFAPFCFAAWR